jgi:serine/threonine protein phosphatase 1
MLAEAPRTLGCHEPTRTIAIGDIHGCAVALQTLIEAIQPQPADTVIPLGDYIDRGPDSRGVIEQLIALNGRCRLIPLRGNHEEMFLAAVERPDKVEAWLQCGGTQMLRSNGINARLENVPQSHIEFLRSTRDWFETETRLPPL